MNDSTNIRNPHREFITPDNVVMLCIDHQAAIFEGDHKVHVIQVSHDTLTLDTRFELDFNAAGG